MNTFRVAVVGSGPAGLYTADALVRSAVEIEVDIIDRLPTPYGLVRYGVAPDHPRIKSIITALQRILEHDQVRFLGDVTVGRDVTPDELDDLYDAVVYASGASRDRKMIIPGEDLRFSCSATDFVSWYSGHPDSAHAFNLDTESVVVVGAGNVALDVARVLAKSAEELSGTDMPEHVLEKLAASRVTDVHVVCRRGPEHVKFTTKELRELGDLEDVDTVIDPTVIPTTDPDDHMAAANLKVLRELAVREVPAAARRIHFHFWRRPMAITGSDAVDGIQLEVVKPGEQGLEGTGRLEEISAGMVIRSVGYLSVPIGSLPFDDTVGRIPNVDGRVTDAQGIAMAGRYVAGWIKRGPSGVVGTNRACATGTVQLLLADLAGKQAGGVARSGIDDLLFSRGVRPVTYDGWLSIDRGEVELGEEHGRTRTKIVDWSALRRLGVHVSPTTK